MPKPRILIIENSIDITGALKSITRTAIDLRDQFDFTFIIPQNSKSRYWIEGKGFSQIYELPLMEVSKRITSLIFYVPFLLWNAFKVSQIVKREKPSIIHVNDLYNLIPVVLKISGVRVPYICHIRFLPNRFPAWLFTFWLRLHFRYASKIIAVSNYLLQLLPVHDKLIVIHDELPIEERYPELIKPNLHKSHYTFLYLSNFIKGKGQDYALESFSKIHRNLPNWKIRFVGGDLGLRKNMDFRKKLEEHAEKLNIYGKTEWVAFTDDVEKEYKSAEVILNFSESESFSITCLEALFFSRPVIATNCGGPAEIIENAKTGYLVLNRDVNSMAKAMEALALNTDLRLRMGESAKASVKEKFSIKNTSYKINAEYGILLNQA